ncbi:MAG: enoyl-CoA hydratase/isomerase family protein [Planctomycetaceae bacterium]|nr:enoyl-CoA hydratase/isomerase family protein [Planctomycetaceae bacterium]
MANHTITHQLDRDGALARITFANGRGNILTTALLRDLREAVKTSLDNRHLKLITLQGLGANFSYGASIEEHAPAAIAGEMRTLRGLVMEIACSPVPFAALVRGYCLGGGFELAMGCHFIFSAAQAQFGLPEIKLGVFPPAACAVLPRLVGQALADRMVISGEKMSGEDLARRGLVHSVFDGGDLEAGVDRWFGSSLAGYSASSLRHATMASRTAFVSGLDEAIAARERDYVDKLLPTHDAQEGVRAFLAKRPPAWRDE